MLIAGLSGVQGALVVAFDEKGDPLTSGAHQLDFSYEGTQIETLFALCRELGSRLRCSEWMPVSLRFLRLPKSSSAFALPVGDPPGSSGLVIVACDSPGPLARSTRDSLRECRTLLAAAIQSSIRTEAWYRIEQLQELARRTFQDLNWDLKALTQHLAELFHADVVTILLEERDELHLASSTDQSLGRDRPVIYRQGQGLTGFIFESGKALRLSNTDDAAEIQRVAGIKRERPLHPERDAEGRYFTWQFLGVPMLFGGKAVGVIRMGRRGGSARFTLEDEKALQFFADLLGAALAPSWSLLLSRSVLESVSEAIAVSHYERDASGAKVRRIVMANQGAEKLLGLPESELQGRDARTIYAPGEYDKIREGLSRAISEGRSEYGPVPSRMQRADGALVPVVISYRILANRRISPASFYIIGLARDTSESERLAERHQSMLELLDAIGVVYFQADQNGITLEPTRTEPRITGYSLEELRGFPREKLYLDPRERARLLDRAREHQGQLTRELQQMRRKDGSFFWAEGDLRIVNDAEGREIGLEGFYRDVTDRILLQGFLNEDTKKVLGEHELFARLKADAEFHLDYLISLGHQLQTPLGSLIETLRNFEKGVMNQRQLAERLPYVIGQAVVCSRLVRNLSYMDKILRGEPFQRQAISLAKLAIETKLDFLHLLRERRLELIVDDESINRHLRVQGHREMLRQTLVNLIDNAIKYSLPGSTIHIRAKVWPQGPTLEISNYGFPISPEDRKQMFQRGFRTKRAQALIPHGTGLGLWLVRKIVEAHDASIRCHEVIEDGQKRVLFRITFPHSTARPRRHS